MDANVSDYQKEMATQDYLELNKLTAIINMNNEIMKSNLSNVEKRIRRVKNYLNNTIKIMSSIENTEPICINIPKIEDPVFINIWHRKHNNYSPSEFDLDFSKNINVGECYAP